MSLLDNTSDLIMPDIDWLRDNGFDVTCVNGVYTSIKWFVVDIDLSMYGVGKICCKFRAIYDLFRKILFISNIRHASMALMLHGLYFNSHSVPINDRDQITIVLAPEYLSQHFRRNIYECIR